TRTSHQQAVSFWNGLFSIGVWEHSFHNTPKDTAMAQDTSIVLPYARMAGKKVEADFVWRDARARHAGGAWDHHTGLMREVRPYELLANEPQKVRKMPHEKA